MSRPTRAIARRARLLLLGVTLTSLVACGQVQDDRADSAPDGSATGDTSAFPLSFENTFGTTEVEEAPERVVVVGYSDQDAVLGLGVKPVAVREWFGEYPKATWPWASDLFGDTQPEVLGGELDYDKIFELDPDLIIGVYAGLDRASYQRLSKIAPVLIQPEEYPDYGMPWRESTRMIAEALGREDAADDLIAGAEDALATAKEEHPDLAGRTFTFGYDFGDGELGIYGEGDPRYEFLTELGMEPAPANADRTSKEGFVTIDEETIDLVDGDLVLWVDYTGAGTASVRDNAAYQQLPVAREGRDIFLAEDDLANGAVSFGSALSIPVALDELVDRIELAADGDPATSSD